MTGGLEPGRLALTQVDLEEIFRGGKKKTLTWKKILNGAKFTEASKKACEKKATVIRVVRQDRSGVTDALKKFLGQIEPGPVYAPAIETWVQNAEKIKHTAWPHEATDPVLRATGGSGVVNTVAATEGSIGYASLADARVAAFIPPSGGAGTALQWAYVANNPGATSFAEPSSDGEITAKENANCGGNDYGFYAEVMGKPKWVLPASTAESWNDVTTNERRPTTRPAF